MQRSRKERTGLLFTAPSWRCRCCYAQQEHAMPGTQLYFQNHGGDLGWDDTCSFRCFPVCLLSGWPNVLPISCAAVLGWPIPTASSWSPQCYNPVVYAQHSQLGSLEVQGCLVRGLFLFPWCTMWPHLGFL